MWSAVGITDTPSGVFPVLAIVMTNAIRSAGVTKPSWFVSCRSKSRRAAVTASASDICSPS